jgi:phage recombination protein Bet
MSNTQVVATNGNSGAVVDVGGQMVSQKTFDLVKKVVFPDGTADELCLYFHKCKLAGVSPLDRKIYPIKYAGRLTFVGSIDYMRSKAAASGQFDGCDDVEYEEGNGDHPEEAIVRVYRKGIDRPFVDRARWSEYVGTTKDGATNAQWKSKPYLMLAKCAESAALRKAFPDELGGIYDEAEFAVAMDAPEPKSGKPKITAADVVVIEEAEPLDSILGERKTGIVEGVSRKDGTNKNGKPYTRYGVTINGVIYGTFDDKIGDRAQDLTGQPVVFTASDDGKYKNLLTIELDDAGAK